MFVDKAGAYPSVVLQSFGRTAVNFDNEEKDTSLIGVFDKILLIKNV